MSWEAAIWALKQAPVNDAQTALILLGLADHASDTGHHAFPSQAALAACGRCSDRTVRRCLAELEEQGLIRRGDQQIVAHVDTRHRPVVWDLAMERRR